MSDELKAKFAEFLQRELDELKQNKIRVTALGVCLLMLIAFWWSDDGTGVEKIDLSDSPPATKNLPVTKDLPVQKLPVKVSNEAVKIVMGASNDELFVNDPFQGAEKPKPPPAPKVITSPPAPIIQQSQPAPPPKTEPKEKIILTGTAISGDNKTAMFLRDKHTEFLTVGDEIGGQKIFDVGADFVIFEGGERLYLQKELNR